MYKKFIVALTAATFFAVANAEIFVPKIFDNNMVLQRQRPVKIWGTALKDAKVDVIFGSQKKSINADAEGKWSLYLDAMEADKNPKDFLIYENGKEAKKFSNVLVGEVWILSGQSNMQVTIKDSFDFKKAESRANYPNLRTVSLGGASDKPQNDVSINSRWESVSPQNAQKCSAIGFYFGEQLMKDLNVPVGLIHTAVGSSKMCTWIARQDCGEIKYLENRLAEWQADMKNFNYPEELKKWKVEYAKIKEENEKLKAENKAQKRLPNKPYALSKMMSQQTPTLLYNAKIHPILGLTVRGVLWYQGESDVANQENVQDFEAMFTRLICSWRKNWNDENLYFLCVQLAGFGTGRDWATVRWHQFLVAEKLPNTALANIVDLGEKNQIHPRNKTEVGLRLEKLALRKVYGKRDVRANAPRVSKVSYQGESAEICLKMSGQKLVGKGEPRGFEVKINDKWSPAKAELRGNVVKVFSGETNKKINGVRYLWKSWTGDDVWLFNEDGLPAFPFINEK